MHSWCSGVSLDTYTLMSLIATVWMHAWECSLRSTATGLRKTQMTVLLMVQHSELIPWSFRIEIGNWKKSIIQRDIIQGVGLTFINEHQWKKRSRGMKILYMKKRGEKALSKMQVSCKENALGRRQGCIWDWKPGNRVRFTVRGNQPLKVLVKDAPDEKNVP